MRSCTHRIGLVGHEVSETVKLCVAAIYTSRNASIVGRAYFRLYTHAQEQDARVLWTCCRVEVTFYVVRNGWKKAQAGRVGRVRNGRERRSDGSRSVYRPVSRVLFYGSALLLFSARSPCCDAAPSRPLRPLNFNVRCTFDVNPTCRF